MEHPSIGSRLRPAWEALRLYWAPMLLIQVMALGVVIVYYRVPVAAAFFQEVAQWRASGGLLLAAAATVVSGGLLPELLKRVFRPPGIRPPGMEELAHQLAMWALLGMLIDRFYALQGIIFGHGTGIPTLLCKMLFDQLVFTPLVSVPMMAAWFMLHEARYRPATWWRLCKAHLVQRTLTLWLTCLSFWPVMLLIVYSLPHDLQFPLFLFGNAAYSILLIFIMRRQVGAGTRR